MSTLWNLEVEELFNYHRKQLVTNPVTISTPLLRGARNCRKVITITNTRLVDYLYRAIKTAIRCIVHVWSPKRSRQRIIIFLPNKRFLRHLCIKILDQYSTLSSEFTRKTAAAAADSKRYATGECVIAESLWQEMNNVSMFQLWYHQPSKQTDSAFTSSMVGL